MIQTCQLYGGTERPYCRAFQLTRLGFLVTNVVMMVVGVRLLWAWRRVRTAPELAIGIAYCLGTFGLVLLVVTVTVAPLYSRK